jgi:hypothetical protein
MLFDVLKLELVVSPETRINIAVAGFQFVKSHCEPFQAPQICCEPPRVIVPDA